MIRVHRMITDRFKILPGAEIALEMDPRVLDRDQVDTLAELGFNRASFGLQDTDHQVQQAINRVHTVERVQECVEWVRDAGFISVNLDLIYGLPFQTPESWTHTLDDMDILKPDRVAMYGFAFIPSKMKQQKYMNPDSLPDSQQRFEQFLAGLEWFTGRDYEYIGLDHFAVQNDELAVAYRDHTLQRNFMGYTTLAGTILIGLGNSAITNLQSCFVQNHKHLAGHERSVNNSSLPVERGMSLSTDDQVRSRIIQELMCFNSLNMADIGGGFGIDFASVFADELAQLRVMADDGLVTIEKDRIETTLLGHALLRNVASIFDAYLQADAATGQAPVYSKTI
jgi:oxygen-independent coproporphyrinogen-3 oxidase